jgi:hypothetical protein
VTETARTSKVAEIIFVGILVSGNNGIMPENIQREKPDREETDGKKDAGTESGYYYDDAHGYQRFDPDAEDEDDDEPCLGSSSD